MHCDRCEWCFHWWILPKPTRAHTFAYVWLVHRRVRRGHAEDHPDKEIHPGRVCKPPPPPSSSSFPPVWRPLIVLAFLLPALCAWLFIYWHCSPFALGRVEKIPGLQVIGEPQMSLVAIKSDQFDIYRYSFL